MKLDELLPSYDVAARRDILVQAAPADTAAALEQSEFSQSRLTRLLLGLGTLGRGKPDGESGTQVERLRRAGFIELGNAWGQAHGGTV